MTTFDYTAICPAQNGPYQVFAFCAEASDILRFARIDRIGRCQDGSLVGFQRPQIASHIKEIRDYLSRGDAILPNSIVIAFTDGVTVTAAANGTANIRIGVEADPPGLVVDGQQRLSALEGLPNRGFQVLVSGILCSSEDELRKQFILINNTRPLPKQLIYELLPTVDGLPHRLSSRARAASLVERLNYEEGSSLRGQIKQHTNPSGVIQDTSIQKLIMSSLSDGALRELARQDDGNNLCFELLSHYFRAVQRVFPEAWFGHSPKTSRLVHSTGIVAMGYVMEYLHAIRKAFDPEDFEPDLLRLKDITAWTAGTWNYGEGNQRPWNNLQFVPRDYLELSQFLIRRLKST